MSSSAKFTFPDDQLPELAEAEAVLAELANVFINGMFERETSLDRPGLRIGTESGAEELNPNLEDKYRALLEQIPAVVFMAYLDRGVGEVRPLPHEHPQQRIGRAERLPNSPLSAGSVVPELF